MFEFILGFMIGINTWLVWLMFQAQDDVRDIKKTLSKARSDIRKVNM